MEHLSNNNFKDAYQVLKTAERIATSNYAQNKEDEVNCKLFSLTMNNLGCYYKK